VKYASGKLYVSIVFEVLYKPYTQRGIIALDINLRQVTVFNGCKVRRYRTRFVNALSKKAQAEELQRKYPKRWRYNHRILNRVRSLYRRAGNIVVDWCRKFAKQIVLRAVKLGYAVALEDLEHLEKNIHRNHNSDVVWKLTMFAYRKLQVAIVNKAIEYGVPVVFVDPRNTSSMCPRCGEKLVYTHRLGVCRKCGLKMDRDAVGAMNIWLRVLYAYAGEPGSPQTGAG